MRNIFIKVVVFTLIISSLIGNSNVFANVNSSTDNIEKETKIDIEVNETINEIKEKNVDEYTVDVEKTLGLNEENLDMNVVEGSEDEMLVQSKIESGDTSLNSDLYINLDKWDFFVTEEVELENGESKKKVYDVFISEIEGESFKAHLIDRESGEIHEINTIDANSSALPVVVALIVRAGLQYVIKHYGKKVAMQAMIDLGVSQITKAYGGTVKNAKNGKGKVITIPNKKQTIVIRLMEAGSGGRKEAYWRMSVGNKSVNRAGNYSNNANETHITLQESSPSTIIKLIKKYKK
ncbi:SAR2788 family putative toxin [Cytobacillus horneckiae]|uniref:SAR2788 family putative toxin n=1 Tax=Cytobacillus horneckiae TaxID=549687 RepID=UPI003D9AAE03